MSVPDIGEETFEPKFTACRGEQESCHIWGPRHITYFLVAGAMAFRPASILWRIECCLFEPVRFSLTLHSILEETTGGERRGERTGPLGVFPNLPCFSSLEPKGKGEEEGCRIDNSTQGGLPREGFALWGGIILRVSSRG